jgi:uncharacterized membrane protein
MKSERAQILEWTELGAIARDRLRAALRAAGVLPDAAAWRRFLDRLLLWCGALCLAAALAFFVAYNWSALGRFAKFGLVQALLLAAIAIYWKLGPDRASAKAALFSTAVLMGVLLALFGQTYQTGADTWELFATWAALILPWVLLGRLAALWLFWIALLNVSIMLYFSVFPSVLGWIPTIERTLLLLFALDTAALAAWQLVGRHIPWLAQRWAVRVLAVGSAAAATGLALHAIFAWDEASGVAAVLYPVWLGALYLVYRRLLPDLFMLALGCLSAIVVATGGLTEHVLDWNEPGGFLLIAVVVVGMAAAAAVWLRRVSVQEAA